MSELNVPLRPDGSPAFDAVVMLTWSDWRTEPRSNRYHYASRFARRVPVLFLQSELEYRDDVRVERTELPGVEIVSVPRPLSALAVEQILDLLVQRGIRRPLLWIYNCIHYAPLLRHMPQSLRVYHATEDYFTPAVHWADQEVITAHARALLAEVDLVVGVSAEVNRSYVDLGGYTGALHLAPNGCDAGFLRAIAARETKPPREKVCLFQGGINSRVDYALLEELAGLLPDWTFWFCGNAKGAPPAWQRVLAHPNVEYLGELSPEGVAQRMCQATVGLIPFVQDAAIWNSLPLKAYEYVACGLPVVTVPIASLQDEPELFRAETTAQGFARAIVAAGATRTDARALEQRARAAQARSYDARFEGVLEAIGALARRRWQQRKRLNVCVLYDIGSQRVNTIKEHLESFGRYSRHDVVYMPGTDVWVPGFSAEAGDDATASGAGPDFSLFDAVIVHYSVRVNVDGHMTPAVERALARFRGVKVVFLQDEYETPEGARRWFERVGVNLVYTCVPPQDVHKLYPRERFPWIEFRQTLTGYVPEDESIDAFAMPLAQRPHLFGYRGRKLPAIYGELGWEKFVIGREVRRLADERGLPVDVEVDDSKRIYGPDWYRFLGSARATLGTESGSNLFDFEGTAAALIKARQAADPQADYGSMRDELVPYERLIRMNQISPKIFEAIRTRTALVLFEGEYSGVVRAHEHYIPLKKDFSNFDQVVRMLQDDAQVQELTERAYRDIVESGRYGYRQFVAGIDHDMEQAAPRPARVRLFSLPLLAFTAAGRSEHVPLEQAAAALLGSGVVDRDQVRETLELLAKEIVRRNNEAAEAATWRGRAEAASLASVVVAAANAQHPSPPQSRRAALRRAWNALPEPVRAQVGGAIRGVLRSHHRPDSEKSGLQRTLSFAWGLVPGVVKRVARRAIYGGR